MGSRRVSESIAGQGTAPRKLPETGANYGDCPGTAVCATNPECKGAQIFQKSHRQIADVGRRGLLTAAELYFLHKIRLNFRALKASQPALKAPVS
jgi:hypothetical protein